MNTSQACLVLRRFCIIDPVYIHKFWSKVRPLIDIVGLTIEIRSVYEICYVIIHGLSYDLQGKLCKTLSH